MGRGTAFIAGASIIAGGIVVAGPLTPPAGPVAGTYKTLAEIEPRIAISSLPFTINQPGSYYLTGNLTGVAGSNGITVNAPRVTIDLNGFSLRGVGAGSLSGVACTVGVGVKIRNGSIMDWGQSGLFAGAAPGIRVEGISAVGNGGIGIVVGFRSSVIDCTVIQNSGGGISTGSDSQVMRCVLRDNLSASVGGISLSSGCRVSECVASFNDGSGIVAGTGCTIESCTTGGNASSGINAATGCTIQACTSNSNGTDGITAGMGCSILHNTCTQNNDDGVQAASACRVVGNTSVFNGYTGSGAGVYLTGSGNRVEDNHLDTNRYGVYTPGAAMNNVIVRNSAGGNVGQNYMVSAGNELGPVVTNPGSNNFATMTAWSNIAY